MGKTPPPCLFVVPSTDGPQLIYFVGTGRSGGALGGFRMAVSRAFYLHATYLLGQGLLGQGPDGTWRGGLRIAARGRLWTAELDADQSISPFREFHDSNCMTYQAIPAPYETGAGQGARP